MIYRLTRDKFICDQKRCIWRDSQGYCPGSGCMKNKDGVSRMEIPVRKPKGADVNAGLHTTQL